MIPFSSRILSISSYRDTGIKLSEKDNITSFGRYSRIFSTSKSLNLLAETVKSLNNLLYFTKSAENSANSFSARCKKYKYAKLSNTLISILLIRLRPREIRFKFLLYKNMFGGSLSILLPIKYKYSNFVQPNIKSTSRYNYHFSSLFIKSFRLWKCLANAGLNAGSSLKRSR